MDDIIERRRKENPKLKAHSLKRKRDSVVTAATQDENNGSDVDMVSDEEEDVMNSLQLSEDEGGEGVFLRSSLWDCLVLGAPTPGSVEASRLIDMALFQNRVWCTGFG